MSSVALTNGLKGLQDTEPVIDLRVSCVTFHDETLFGTHLLRRGDLSARHDRLHPRRVRIGETMDLNQPLRQRLRFDLYRQGKASFFSAVT